MKKAAVGPKIAVVLFFVGYLIMGLWIFKDYGVMVDDPNERYSSLIVFNTFFPYTCAEENDACPHPTDLYTYWDRNHGNFLQQPMILAEYLRHYQTDLKTVFQLRHLWTFLNVFLSQICFFFLLKKRFRSSWIGIFGVLLFIFSPRLFGNSFYNIKDMIFYAWFTIAMFFLAEFIYDPSAGKALLLGIVSAAAVNARVIGAVVPLLGCVVLAQDVFKKKISAKKFVLNLVILIFSAFFAWVLFTPAAWHNPVKTIFETIHEFSDYTRQAAIPGLYMGKIYTGSTFPWHYLPVWILISSPAFCLAASAIGFILLSGKNIKTSLSPEKQLDLAFAAVIVLIPVLVMLKRPVIYDSWRHFFFLYAAVLYFSAGALDGILSRKNKLWIFLFSICGLVSFVLSGCWMIRNHPYEGTYFNPLVRSYALSHFTKDYWKLSTKECLDFIADSDKGDRVTVWDDQATLITSIYDLNKSDRERISGTSYGYGGEPAKYIISSLYNLTVSEKIFPFYNPIYHVKMDGFDLSEVFERDHTDELHASDVVKSIQANVNPELVSKIMDSDARSSWTTGRPQNNQDALEIFLNAVYKIHGITFFTGLNDVEYPHSLTVEASHDGGKTWQPVPLFWKGPTDFTFDPIDANALRLKNSSAAEETWTIGNLWFYGEKTGENE